METAISILALALSVYTLFITKRNDNKRIDFDIARSVINSIEKFDTVFFYFRLLDDSAEQLKHFKEEYKSLTDTLTDAETVWGEGFKEVASRLYAPMAMYLHNLQFTEHQSFDVTSVNEKCMDDANFALKDVKQYAQERLDAYRKLRWYNPF